MARIAWLLPHAGRNSGGLATAIAHAAALRRNGHECRFLLPDARHEAQDRAILADAFGVPPGQITAGYREAGAADVAIATTWSSAEAAARSGAAIRMLFAQDWEPDFSPAGDDTLQLESVLTLDIRTIALGRWLAARIAALRGMPGERCDFGVDTAIYANGDGPREDAVCFIVQPRKDRRAAATGLHALRLLHERRPGTRILLFGDEPAPNPPFPAEWLGFLPPAELARLYRRCRVGLCLSVTNPSRIPFEMMASGLPVVELYRANTLCDLPAEGCRLAFQSPRSIAYTLDAILDRPRDAASIGASAAAAMATRSRESEQAGTVAAVARALAGLPPPAPAPGMPLYDRAPMVAPADRRAGVRAFVTAERRRAEALAAAVEA